MIKLQEMIDVIEFAQNTLAKLSDGHDDAYKALYKLEEVRIELLKKAE